MPKLSVFKIHKGSPAIFIARPVAFRPCLTAGLALHVIFCLFICAYRPSTPPKDTYPSVFLKFGSQRKMQPGIAAHNAVLADKRDAHIKQTAKQFAYIEM